MSDEFSQPAPSRQRLRCAHWTLIALTLPSFFAGCSSHNKAWDGQVHSWGTMHEVLGEGMTQGRISLADALYRPGATGVGALEELEGEITIADGRSWLAIGGPDARELTDRQAAFLTVAFVPSWTPIQQDGRIASSSQLDDVIRLQAKSARLDVSRPIPFRIRGRVTVAAHVIQGKCPHAQGSNGEGPIKRMSFEEKDADGLIVGFYAENSEGTLTHHGSRTHMHVLFLNGQPRTGHVDSIAVAPGSIIELPTVNHHRTGT